MALDHLSDKVLAHKSAQKNQAAFAVLVKRHSATVRAVSRRLTRGAAEADDIAQTAFLTAWRKIATYSGGSFKSWIGMIVYREFLQYCRKHRLEVPFEEASHADVSDNTFLKAGHKVDLDAALNYLSEPQRICVILCVATGFTHKEASLATGWPLGTVKSHVNRGVVKLRQYLSVDNVA